LISRIPRRNDDLADFQPPSAESVAYLRTIVDAAFGFEEAPVPGTPLPEQKQ
jgi:hypothetical protein